MSSFKQLNKADVTTVPYAANKQWNFTYDLTDITGSIEFGNNEYFKIFSGLYTTGTFHPLEEPPYNDQYKRLIYDSINHMFYQAYSNDLLDTGSLMFNVNTYQSASQQRPTASYFDYNINPLLIKNFPTGAGAEIKVISINQDTFGSKVLPHSFYLSGDNFSVKIKDDGNGNLFDVAGAEDGYVLPSWVDIDYFYDPTSNGISHVGNIFYAHGLIVITNPNYQNIFGDGTSGGLTSYLLQEDESLLLDESSDPLILETP
jgi:hypothetical protein